MGINVPNSLFDDRRRLRGNIFQLRDVNVKKTSGAPSEDYPEGTLLVNSAEGDLYIRVKGADIPSLAAYYKLDESSGTSVTDHSGNGNTGTATSANWVEGKYGNGFDCDGTDDINAGNSSDFDFGENFTWTIWMKPNKVDQSDRALIRRRKDTDNFIALGWNGGTDNKLVFNIRMGGSNNQIQIDTSEYNAEEWNHIAVVRKGSEMFLYVNGEKKADKDGISGTISWGTSNLIIGGDPEFNGQIDEVKIFNSARTKKEIKEDAKNPQSLAWIKANLFP